ncbi:SAUR-like auxin-responsive protein family [Euphorbia peplus]|nr:SAUR-like auxin-responsive protein family [Euphorbia peplus]WCJ37465.1 SAUR-like auxin-responsive protein family [Euphorbia peplus]
MDGPSQSGSSKLTGIRQIVRLKGFLQKWQSVTIGNSKSNNKPKTNTNKSSSHRRRRSNGGISPDISKRLKSKRNCDSDEESCHSPPPADVPKGYLAVYVGPELRRFIIPTTYLSHSLFKVLLEKVEEEFGFDHNGGLTIPCEIEIFKFLLNYMENHPKDKDDHHDRASIEAILSH